MSFELRIDEALPDGIHRIAKKEIEKVRACVDGSSKASRDEMVHEARKSLKKLRALVRLVRPGVGGKLYRRENFAFRDIARPLTEVRDAKISSRRWTGPAEETETGPDTDRLRRRGGNWSATSGRSGKRCLATRRLSRGWILP